MIEVIPFSFLVINLIDAYTDTHNDVNHRRGAFLYAIACIFLSIAYLKFTDVNMWWLVGFTLFTRAAWFDVFWNLLNNQPFAYNGTAKKKDKSFIDDFENVLGISIFWLRIIYIATYIAYLIIYFLYA